MPHADDKFPVRAIPVKMRPVKIGFRCPEHTCHGSLCHSERRWWLRCSDCKRIYLQDE
jgi:hypothetical protein